jgi:uncharacterized membrane protein
MNDLLHGSRTRLAILLLAVAGAAISGYLTTVHFADRPVFCGGISSCETVNTSSYAELLGMPVALLGLGAYLAIAALAVADLRVTWAAPALLFVALIGTLYSGYLTWVELAVLHAVCLWCATSAVVITAITALAAVYVTRAPEAPPAAPARTAPRRARRALR